VLEGLSTEDTEDTGLDSEGAEDADALDESEDAEKIENELATLFASCLDDVIEIVEKQSEEFYREDTVSHPEFESVGIYDYEAEFEELSYSDEESGAITTVMTFTYRYIVRNTERVATGAIWADGTNAWEYQTVPYTGKATAEFSLSWYDEEWHIDSVTLPVIPD